MRKANQSGSFNLLILCLFISVISCNKELSRTGSSGTSGPTTSATSSTIAVSTDSVGTDSVYLLQTCDRGYSRDSISFSALPDTITNYLAVSYSGYKFYRAYEIKDSAGTIGGYVVIIDFNEKPVGLLFDASGHLQKILEQRERGDIDGDGWHHGGRFDDRDGKHRDTIPISSIPSAVSSYFSSNFPGDTLLRAYLNRDSSILVISRDNGLFATVFTPAGVFVKRIALDPHVIKFNSPQIQNIVQDSLPSADLAWLENAYPNYVFETALTVSVNNQIERYGVLLDANNTKYVIWFDAAGNVIVALPVW
ncbi:MAG TPA: hypothetical protein VHT72_02965 [Puia sp.]|nr:hypothetical protein [Puia sp.]